MKLVIGGYAQGKQKHVLQKEKLKPDAVWSAVLPEAGQAGGSTVVIDRFHQWVKQEMQMGRSPEEEIRTFLERCGDCIIICDEIGNGIVPADAFEREYRERVGRILTDLADRAEEVERVICGIGQRIK